MNEKYGRDEYENIKIGPLSEQDAIEKVREIDEKYDDDWKPWAALKAVLGVDLIEPPDVKVLKEWRQPSAVNNRGVFRRIEQKQGPTQKRGFVVWFKEIPARFWLWRRKRAIDKLFKKLTKYYNQ